MLLGKRDVEALLAPLDDEDVVALVGALTVALRIALEEPDGAFDALVKRCRLGPEREIAVRSLQPEALFDLATELAEMRGVPIR